METTIISHSASLEWDAIAKNEGRTRWVTDGQLLHLAKPSPLTDLIPSASQRMVMGKQNNKDTAGSKWTLLR
jgi:hypothetical protein